MGAATGDIDGDGLDDLVVTIDAALEILRGRPSWPYQDMSTQSGVATIDAESGLAEIPWGVQIADIDADGRPDLLVAHGNDTGAWTDPNRQIGPQHFNVDWNGGDFRFADVSDEIHAGAKGQWRSLDVGDLDGDGDPDVVVGGMGILPSVYRNDIDRGFHGFSLLLVGTSSNVLGLGARIEVVPAGGGAPRRYSVPRVGEADLITVPEVFVGLGDATSAQSVRITWPSGVVQVLHDVAAGALHRVVEPPLFDIDPPDRHVTLAQGALVTITVHPRNDDGTIRAGADIAITAVGGEAVTERTRKVLADGSVAIQLYAPSTAGSSRLEIRIDGVASGVRPRIFWDTP